MGVALSSHIVKTANACGSSDEWDNIRAHVESIHAKFSFVRRWSTEDKIHVDLSDNDTAARKPKRRRRSKDPGGFIESVALPKAEGPASVPAENKQDEIHVDLSDNATASRKPKRRRRSNTALGGLITDRNIEALAAESKQLSAGLSSTGRNRSRRSKRYKRESCNDKNYIVQSESSHGEEASDAALSLRGKEPALVLDHNDTRAAEEELSVKADNREESSQTEKPQLPTASEAGGQGSMGCHSTSSDTSKIGLMLSTLMKSEDNEACKEQSLILQKEAELCAKIERAEISSSDISTRIGYLFPKEATTKPCVSARLFACVSILLEKSMTDGPSRWRRRLRSKPPSKLQAMQPLIEAFVQAELTTLGDFDKEYQSRKKLRFCSVDYSATLNPVDRKLGSNTHLEACIDSLHAVLKEIDSLCIALRGGSAVETKECVGAMVAVLRYIGSDSGVYLREECSKSMPVDWPSSRFVRPAHMYQEEVQNLSLSLSSGESCCRATSQVRERLGDFIGRAIRFYLRRFFDSCPATITTPSADHVPVDLSASRSRIHEIVEMMPKEGDERDTAAADGSISSVFSSALRCIKELAELRQELVARGRTDFIESLCSSEACRRGLGSKSHPYILSEEDLRTIEVDINEAHILLAGAKATKFIYELMHWNGVMEGIKAVGGFEKVERYAKLFQAFRLSVSCPEESHLTLLEDVGSFVTWLDSVAKSAGHTEKVCEETLRTMWQRFRCGTRKRDILQQNPRITDIKAHLENGAKLSVFPALGRPSAEDYEEEE